MFVEGRVFNMVRIVIIGMGNMGSKYARMILDGTVHDVELVAVTRVRPERLDGLKELVEQKIPIYQSADELFAGIRKREVMADAALIVTPHNAHESQVLEAFQAGLHVLCDKPSGVYSIQARHMNEAAKGTDKVFAMMFNQRTNPLYQKMKEIVEQGIYGSIKRVNWVITDWYRPNIYYDEVAWRGTWSTDGGGILLNQCPHNLDLLQWICGMPVSVQAFCKEGKYHNIEVEDEVTAYMEFGNGATGVFYSTTGEAPGINRLEISLEDALLVCEDNRLKICELGFQEREYRKTATESFAKLQGTWKDVECPAENTMHKGILQNFVDCIQGNCPLMVQGEEGIKSLLLSNAMYLSSWQKRMIVLPVTEEEQQLFEAEFVKGFQENANRYK